MTGLALAAAARMLVGSRFRLHGRDPATGLDCMGVVDCALRAIGRDVGPPPAYGLRNRDLAPLFSYALNCGLDDATGPLKIGDVMLFDLSGAQSHLAIVTDAQRFIHAHAALRRVVEGRCGDDWQVRARWRIAD